MTRPEQPYTNDSTEQLRDPCWTHLGRLAANLREFGEPDGMHRVGSIDGIEVDGHVVPLGGDLPALLAGVGEAHTSLPGDDASIEIARTLLMRILASAPPGAVRVSVFDGELSGAFGDFAHLGTNQFNLVPPGGLRGLLDDLAAHIIRLRHSHTTAGTPAEPWRVAVLVGTGSEVNGQVQEQINRLIAQGADWGSIIALGVNGLEANQWLREGWPEGVRIRPDPPLPSDIIEEVTRGIARTAEQGMAPPPLDLVIPPGELWTRSAVKGLQVPLGLDPATGRPYEITIGDEFPHAIITGQAGSGKSLTLKTMIFGAAQNYSPTEMQVSVLDYKEGTEFASVAPSANDPTFLPHARLVGSNVNEDPEFGLNALIELQLELKRRANRSRELGVTNYMDLRAHDPDGIWPRRLMVIDEFQVLLQGEGGAQALEVLIDLARRGRSFGIHLVLASQNVAGIAELYTKADALFKNMPLRIAGRQGSVFNIQNATDIAELPRLHLVVNTNSGEPGFNKKVRVGAAFTDPVRGRQQELWQHRPEGAEPPRVFDAARVPVLTEARDYQRLRPARVTDPKLLVAEEFSVRGGSAGFTLTRQPGRNFVVVGQRTREVASVMGTAARSLAKQVPPGRDTFSLVCLDNQHAQTVERLADDLTAQGHNVQVVGVHEARRFLQRTREAIGTEQEGSHYLFMYGADAGGATMSAKPKIRTHIPIPPGHELRVGDGNRVMPGTTIASVGMMKDPIMAPPIMGTVRVEDGQVYVESEGVSGHEELRTLLSQGPENGTHVIASFSGPERLRDVLGGHAVRPEVVGGYVSLDASDQQMNTFTPGAPPVIRPPVIKPWRGRYYDRFTGGQRRTVIPYDDPSVVMPDEDEDEY